MISEMMQEYLVGLGFKVDKAKYQEMDNTLHQADKSVSSTTGNMSKSFEKSGKEIANTVEQTGKKAISSAENTTKSIVNNLGYLAATIAKTSAVFSSTLATMSLASAKLMKTTAEQDLQMQTFATRMMMTKDAAWQMKKATDALGVSISDIVITPELMDRYKALIADSQKMKPTGDFAQTMKGMRDILFEFTRFKQEVSYLVSWVGYYMVKNLAGSLGNAKATIKSFNDYIIQNMQQIAQRLAKLLTYIISVALQFVSLIRHVTSSMQEMWDSFPIGVKKVIEAVSALWIVFRASPMGKVAALFALLYKSMNDGSMNWEKLHNYIDIATKKIEEFANIAEPYLEKFGQIILWVANKLIMLAEEAWPYVKRFLSEMSELISWASDKFIDLKNNIEQFIETIRNSQEFQDFVNTMEELWSAAKRLGSGIFNLIATAVRTFYDALKDDGNGSAFKGLLQEIWRIFLRLINAISYCINIISDWLDELSRSPTVRMFMIAIADLAKAMWQLFTAIMQLVGTAFESMFRGMSNRKPTNSFRNALREILMFIVSIIKFITKMTNALTKLFKKMESNKSFVEFWRGIGRIVSQVGSVILSVIQRVGLLGQALIALVNGDFQKAKNLASAALNPNLSSMRQHTEGLPQEELQYEAAIQQYSKEYGVDPNLVRAVMKNESGFDQSAISPTGAIGLMQLEPGTAAELGVNPYDAQENIKGGVMYLRQMLDAAGGDPQLAVQMYNAGPGNPGGADMPYVGRVMGDYESYGERTTYENGVTYDESNIPQQGGVDLADIDPQLLQTADSFLEGLQKEGYDVQISSGYRSPEHSVAVGGYADDPHTQGRALDFVINSDYNPDDIVAAGAAHGLNLTYEDSGGSGYHFHTQMSEDDKWSGVSNPIGGDSGGSNEGMPSMGAMFNSKRRGIGLLAKSAMGAMQSMFAQADPLLLSNAAAGAANSYGDSSIYINVGDIYVTKQNATNDDVGNTVADKMAERAQYFLINRAMNGSPELK